MTSQSSPLRIGANEIIGEDVVIPETPEPTPSEPSTHSEDAPEPPDVYSYSLRNERTVHCFIGLMHPCHLSQLLRHLCEKGVINIIVFGGCHGSVDGFNWGVINGENCFIRDRANDQHELQYDEVCVAQA